MSIATVDLFAGPGGWDLAAKTLDLDPLGIEWDESACATREAAGLRTRQADVAELDPLDFAPCDLLIASPPCQAFSRAGKQEGIRDLPAVYEVARELAADQEPKPRIWSDPRSALVTEPLRWALALEPTFCAWEQVPDVLPFWRYCAELLERAGWRTWTGVLEAERFGVPQTRERAILLASRSGLVEPPRPTHQRYVKGEPQRHEITLEGEILPWISMAEALDWPTDHVLRNGANSMQSSRDPKDMVPYERTVAAPAPTLDASKVGSAWKRGPKGSHKDAPMSWKFRNHDDQRRERQEGRDTAREGSAPAPTLTSKARSDEWVYDTRQTSAIPRGGLPAPTLTAQGLAKGRDVIRRTYVNGNQDNAARRDQDEPAPTVHFGHALNQVEWAYERPAPTLTTTRRSDKGMLVGRQLPKGEGRNVGGRNWGGDGPQPNESPATNVAGDPRLSSRSHHNHGEQNGHAIRVSLEEAATLQTFPSDYPFDGLAVPEHVSASWAVEGDHALPDELVRDIYQRGVRFAVRFGAGKDGQVLEGVVVPDSVDVVNNLARLRVGQNAMLRDIRGTARKDVAMLVDSQEASSLAFLVRVERVAVEPPLLPVPGAETAGDGCAFAVLTCCLGWSAIKAKGAVPSTLVVHETHALGAVGSITSFDFAESHVPDSLPWAEEAGNSRTKQFEQIGNAVPPLLARAILEALLP